MVEVFFDLKELMEHFLCIGLLMIVIIDMKNEDIVEMFELVLIVIFMLVYISKVLVIDISLIEKEISNIILYNG